VLGELSRAISVERAYVVLDENPTRMHTWSAEERRIRRAGPNRR
jgi:hypothetical protein